MDERPCLLLAAVCRLLWPILLLALRLLGVVLVEQGRAGDAEDDGGPETSLAALLLLGLVVVRARVPLSLLAALVVRRWVGLRVRLLSDGRRGAGGDEPLT